MTRLPSHIVTFIREAVLGLVRDNDSRIAARIRQRLHRTSTVIGTGVRIIRPANFHGEPGSAVHHGTYVFNTGGSVVLGRNSHLGAFCYVNAHRGTVRIGENVAIGPGTKIVAYSNALRPGGIVTEEHEVADVVIGDNVFIGANCTILPGTVVEDDVGIGAGAVVRGTLAANNVYAGVPCKVIRRGWYR